MKMVVAGSRKCEICGRGFFGSSQYARFCSDGCRHTYWQTRYPNKVASPKTIGEIERAAVEKIEAAKLEAASIVAKLNENLLRADSELDVTKTELARVRIGLERTERRLAELEQMNEEMAAPRAWHGCYGRGKPPKHRLPKGFYVYGWYFHSRYTLPFCIGYGYGDRAWQVHLVAPAEKAFCETLRTKDMKVVVYRENMTREGAMLVEAVLEQVFSNLGAPLTNRAETMKRRERPPLIPKGSV